MSDRMHPEGAPGAQEALLRQQWGDATYEAWRDHQEATRAADVLTRSAQIDLLRAQAENHRAEARRADARTGMYEATKNLLAACILAVLVLATAAAVVMVTG